MKFSPPSKTKKLGMIYTILECFCSFLVEKSLGKSLLGQTNSIR